MSGIIVGAVIGLCIFIIPILSYREGIRIGMTISKGVEPEKVRTPTEKVRKAIKEVRDIKTEHEEIKANKKFEEDMKKFMDYTGDVEEEE